MDNMNKPAAPCIEEQQHSGAGTQFFYSPGLTKLEYAAVHIAAGLRAKDHESASWMIAEQAVSDARAVFAELEKEQ